MKVQCSHCAAELDVSQTEIDEAQAEARQTFADQTQPLVFLCDDCWEPFMEWMREHHPDALRDG